MSIAAASAPVAQVKTGPVVRVMVVDDSAVIRGFLTRWIDSEPGLKVVATAQNGKIAVDQVKGRRSGRHRARHRDAGDGWHHGVAAAYQGEPKEPGHHCVDALAPEC